MARKKASSLSNCSSKNKDWSVYTDKERYVAGMVLSGVGDALGFKNGDWENCTSGAQIHKELNSLGGLENICVKNWIHKLIKTLFDMKGRAAGLTCMEMCKRLDPYKQNGYRIPYSTLGGGCGAAMRSMCIGLRYPRPKDIHDLVEVSIESGRMTHHHPTGYLGSLAFALFASYAVQNREIGSWGVGLLETTRLAKRYVRNKGLFVEENMKSWDYFESKWEQFLTFRKINDGRRLPHFSVDSDDVRKRDQFYRMMSFENTGGASGHDAPMMAYDALLACDGKWEELCKRAMFHGGDSDSTGTIAGFLFGVLYCFQDVPKCNYKQLEYRERLENAWKKLYDIVFSY